MKEKGFIVWEVELSGEECPRHGGKWGDDLTCEQCTDDNGEVRRVVGYAWEAGVSEFPS